MPIWGQLLPKHLWCKKYNHIQVHHAAPNSSQVPLSSAHLVKLVKLWTLDSLLLSSVIQFTVYGTVNCLVRSVCGLHYNPRNAIRTVYPSETNFADYMDAVYPFAPEWRPNIYVEDNEEGFTTQLQVVLVPLLNN